MSDQTEHPTPDELHAYSLGKLPEDRAVAIDDHISSCEPCSETIVSLSSDDTFTVHLKEARSSAGGVPAPLVDHPRYDVENLIGRGGMGDVYKARHRVMDRTVALKVINRELVRKSGAVDRFQREVKAAARLSHPNIVTAHDAEQAGDTHFLVMEYVDGVDLSRLVKDRGALPIADACDYIRQAAVGLQHAHEQGMVHRDIKPHNLMLTAGGTVKILDFGLASLAPAASTDSESTATRTDLTAAGEIMGTPDFISPEQAQSARDADIRSDIYSLGATLYFLLSGQPPFAEGSVMHKLQSHAQDEPESLDSLRDDVPADVGAFISKVMAKNPDKRFQTPAEVADALESILQSSAREQTQTASDEPQTGEGSVGASELPPGSATVGRTWLITARCLYYAAFIPLGLMWYDVSSFNEANASEAGRFFEYYLGAALFLATVSGALFAGHKLTSHGSHSDRDSHHILTWDNFETIALAVFFSFLAFLSFQESSPDQPSIVAGGPGVGGAGWYFSSGNTYLTRDEPGVLFGMYRSPGGDRGFSYVVLVRHNSREITEVLSTARAGLNFDGEIASIKDGLTFDGKGIELDLEVLVNQREITSTSIAVDGQAVDASQGRLFLLDLTSDRAAWTQIDAEFSSHLPDPRDLADDTQLVSKLSREVTEQLAKDNETVRRFLAGVRLKATELPSTGNATDQSELRITGKTVNRGTGGLPSVHDWDLSGREVAGLKVRLLLAQNGRADVIQEFDFKELPEEFTSKVRLRVSDAATGADRKRRVNAILYVESPANSSCKTTNQEKGLSIAVEAPFSNSLDRSEVKAVSPGETELLLARSYWKGDMTHSLSMESMTEATKDGNVTFLFVTLNWEDVKETVIQGQNQAGRNEAEFTTKLHTAISQAAEISNEQRDKVVVFGNRL